jgi:hypothetical protein
MLNNQAINKTSLIFIGNPKKQVKRNYEDKLSERISFGRWNYRWDSSF